MSELSDVIREEFQKNDDRRDAGLDTPKDIIRYDNIRYSDDPTWQSLDVYRPIKSEGKALPVIVSVHGGGWVYGDKERYQYYCMSLAQHDFVVVNFSYRLAPETKFPGQIEDINSVFSWIMENELKYGFDINNIFAVGDSAGAHQLGIYATILTNPEYKKLYGLKIPERISLKGISLNCGVYEIDMTNKESMEHDLMYDYLPNKGDASELNLVNFVPYVTEDFPPTLYMTCTGDFMKEQAGILGKVLLEKNIMHCFRYYGDKNHELGHIFHCDMRVDEAHRCNKDECDFFKELI